MECVNATKMRPRDIPNKVCFQNYVESLGLSGKDHLILYDRFNFGFLAAPRAWWIFRVSFILIKLNTILS
jgi:3-mercaptopyruvate sulfurtransferase SseA